MTFTFDGNFKYQCSGSEFQYDSENDDLRFEGESFIEAARDAWGRFRRSDKRRDFVKGILVQQWNDILGEYYTHKTLVFDDNSDEIEASQKRKEN